MTNCKRVLATALAGTTLMCACGASHALGFGRPLSRAVLGDTLWITVPLRLEVGEEINDDCLAADVYFGDDKVAASAVSAALLSGPGGERSLRVSTVALVNEPIITVYLAAGCHARITRKFVAFADPPNVNQPTGSIGKAVEMAEIVNAITTPTPSVVSAPSELSAAMQAAPHHQRSEPSATRLSKREKALAGAPVMTVAALSVDALKADKPSTQGKSSSHKAKGRHKDKAHQSVQLAKSAKSAKPVRSVVKVTQPVDSARLVLDPVEAEAMVAPTLRMSGTLGAPVQADDQSANVQARRDAAAAIWLALNATPEQMTHDRQRLVELEQRLAQLKQEGEQAKLAATALASRAQQAEAQTVSSKVSVLLGLLGLAGVGAAVYLWRQLRQEKKRTEAWWQSQGDEVVPTSSAADDHVVDDFEHDTSPDLASVMVPVAADMSPAFARQDAALAEDKVVPVKLVKDAPFVAVEVSHQVSVEELIDLEQQAEFFMVLGQEDAAIGLLEGHVQHTTGGSPLPFLKLLEAYHRADKRADYQRVRIEFSKRFETDAPSWNDYQQRMNNLVDYPDVVAQLQDIWFTPAQAMEMLDKALTHPEPGACIYDLPAYRELLFLYAVARDLSERDVHDRSSVDLLLPVTDTSGKAQERQGKQAGRSESMIATRPIKARPDLKPEIEIDLPLEDLQIPVDIHKP
jgi:pilus assembly protein FimV